MIQISQIKLPIDAKKEELEQKICRILHVRKEDINHWKVLKRSVDARKKPDLFYVYTVEVETGKEAKLKKNRRLVGNKNIMLTKRQRYLLPQPGTEKLSHRPVIAGSGPAGLFCAWLLAKQGYRPLVIERGDMAPARKKKVETFWQNGTLDENSNVQFGEGGAGTFSDGKLNTSVKDPHGRNRKVLEVFVECGASEEILYDHKPHLGTDQLIHIVTELRKQIEGMGGEFLFRTQLTDLRIENGRLKAIEVNQERWIDTGVLVAAIGHSARDTFALLEKHQISMHAKSFAVGVRIEHPQKMINLSQYGVEASDILGAANYKLTAQLSNGRGVYSFCMCPGGYVVNASSKKEYLAVNGMSYQARDSENANSAMIVTVNPADYRSFVERNREEGIHPLSGVCFQEYLEKKAFSLCQGKVPVQTFGDFCSNRETTAWGNVIPCTKGAWEMSDLNALFPSFLSESLKEGIHICSHKIEGFDRPDAVLSGVESRTSSPVRIERNADFESNIGGIYPCGEGAGYAGGITSAAMDGLKVAEAICKKYMNLL